MQIHLQSDTILQVGNFPITNALITTWVVMLILGVTSWLVTRNLKDVPSTLQNILESIIDAILKLIDTVTGNRELSNKFFSLLATLFLFILCANWIGLLPGVGSIGILKEGTHGVTPLFRGSTTDLNTTMALSFIVVMIIQITGIKMFGWHYFKKFFNFKSGTQFFVGILELISEFTRFIAFTFRLFGNMFAGKVLIIVVTTLIPFVVPSPFIALEVFVGLIQALVFVMLTLLFLKLVVSESH